MNSVGELVHNFKQSHHHISSGFECHVCDSIYEDLDIVTGGGVPVRRVATVDHYGCGAPQKYDLPSPPGVEGWERDIWMWEYQHAAQDVRQLLNATRQG